MQRSGSNTRNVEGRFDGCGEDPLLLSLSFSQTLMQDRPRYLRLSKNSKFNSNGSPAHRFLISNGKLKVNAFKQYESMTVSNHNSSHHLNSKVMMIHNNGTTTQASVDHQEGTAVNDDHPYNTIGVMMSQSSNEDFRNMHVQRSASLATYQPGSAQESSKTSKQPQQLLSQAAIFDKNKQRQLQGSQNNTVNANSYYKNFNLKAAYSIAKTTSTNSNGDLSNQSRSRSHAEIAGNKMMQHTGSQKRVTRINLHGLNNQHHTPRKNSNSALLDQNGAHLQSSGVIATEKGKFESSYKVMNITNQLDDDVQFVDENGLLDPTPANEETHSNEDLQTVAPSIVKKNKKKQLSKEKTQKILNNLQKLEQKVNSRRQKKQFKILHKEVSTARLQASSSKKSVEHQGFVPNQTQQIQLFHRQRQTQQQDLNHNEKSATRAVMNDYLAPVMDQNTSSMNSQKRTATNNDESKLHNMARVTHSSMSMSKFIGDRSLQRSELSMKREGSKALLGVVLKTLYPSQKAHTISKTQLDRPPLPKLGSHGPPPGKYNPNKDFVSVKMRASTIAKDARFDGLKDRNKIEREQVSPMSYKVNVPTDIHRPLDKQNYRGKIPRDRQERLTSSPLYKPSRDVTPAPTETDNTYLLEQRRNISDILKQTVIQEISLDTGFNSEMKNVRKHNLPIKNKLNSSSVIRQSAVKQVQLKPNDESKLNTSSLPWMIHSSKASSVGRQSQDGQDSITVKNKTLIQIRDMTGDSKIAGGALANNKKRLQNRLDSSTYQWSTLDAFKVKKEFSILGRKNRQPGSLAGMNSDSTSGSQANNVYVTASTRGFNN